MDIFNARKIHCIGMGGIGVSALAEFWRAQGKAVGGSDAETGGHRRENVSEVDLVVYSDAVPDDNVERAEARRRGIPELSYAQALGQVSRQYKTIVVTGTHGKSTTTAMLGLMLEVGGLDPLVIVGTRVPQWGNSNIRVPRIMNHESRIMIVEGDDYRDHFLELAPHAVVITSIEWDHPDYFRDLVHTVESFRTLVEKVPDDGFVVLNADDLGCKQLAESMSHSPFRPKRRMIAYNDKREVFSKLQLQVPGQFNRYNAAAAATAAMAVGVSQETVEKVVREFRGVWRRFEVVGQFHDSRFMIHDSPTIISDYGHHPTAIRETMKAAREAYPGRRLVLVYQPHQHSRTKHLFNDFVEVLKDAADLTIVSEIYAVKGRMEDRDVSSRDIVNQIIKSSNHQIINVLCSGNLAETKRVVLEQVQAGDVVIFMGAGDIDSLARQLVHDTRST